MGYDFDTLVTRENNGNMKYSHTPKEIIKQNLISYAGAEMDFKTAPVIIEALQERVENGLYGYTLADDQYKDRVKWWLLHMRNWNVQKEWIVETYGTIRSISTAIRAFTQRNDCIIVQPPVYHRYEQAIRRTNRKVVYNPLIYDENTYKINFKHLEKLMADPNNKMLIICNPHNPIGRVYNETELREIAYLSNKYEKIVVSDEIFAEVTFDDHETCPYISVEGAGNLGIVCTSLGKAFNLTGINNANLIINNDKLRETFIRQRDAEHYGSVDPFSYTAICSAYTEEGANWVKAMTSYVEKNIQIISRFFSKEFPAVKLSPIEGTYVAWTNWSELGLDQDELRSFLIEEAYFHLDDGENYGSEGKGFMRMNIAAPRRLVEKSLSCLYDAAAKRGFL